MSAHLPDLNLQGWPVLRVWRGAVYVRIPRELARPITGGCQCDYCRAHPALVPTWDTLGVPLLGQRGADTWTVHAPEWRSGDRVPAHERQSDLPTVPAAGSEGRS
jgi:hypothetical protein